jgi:hypothetical protein
MKPEEILIKQRSELSKRPNALVSHAQMALAKTFGKRTEQTSNGYTVVAYTFRGKLYVESISEVKE